MGIEEVDISNDYEILLGSGSETDLDDRIDIDELP